MCRYAIVIAALGLLLGVLTLNAEAQLPHAKFNVRDCGAKGDGVAKDTAAVQQAIDTCAAAGGGTVHFAPGKYLCGSLHLKSFVTLYLDNNAVILGSPDKQDYDPYETLNFKNAADEETTYFHHALIWAEDVEHIAILGQGVVDGNFTKRHGPKAIALKRCTFVDIQGIQILNAPNYCISLLGTDWVNIEGVTIQKAFADGIDPDACHNVRISNCHIESSDDAIVPKASFALGERRACENITVTNCYLASESNSFKLGTESGGDFKRIAVSNCLMAGIGNEPVRSGISLESVDGSNIDGVTISNCAMVNARSPIFIRLGNRGRDMAPPHKPGSLKNVAISNISATRASLPIMITGISGYHVEGVIISDVRVSFMGGNIFHPDKEPVPELEGAYPDANMFPSLPAYGLYARHVRDLTLTNVDLRYDDAFWRFTDADRHKWEWPNDGSTPQPSGPGNPGHAVYLDDVQGVNMDTVNARPGADGMAVMRFENVRGALVRGSQAEEGTKTFLEAAGAETRNVHLRENILNTVPTPVALTEGAPIESVVQK